MPINTTIPNAALVHPEHFAAAEQESLFFSKPWFANLLAGVPELAEKPAWVATEQATLPLVRSGSGVLSPVQLSAVRNYYSSLYGPIGDVYGAEQTSAQLEAIRQLAATTLRKFPHSDVIRLDPMADDATTDAIEAGFKNAGLATRRFSSFGNWYLPCAGLTWADYLAKRPGQVRSTIKRKGKKFAALEGARLELMVSSKAEPLSDAQLTTAITAWTQIYNASWKKPEPYPSFVPGLIRTGAEQGWLRFGIAWLGNTPIAAQIWLTVHGKANIYKLAYDEHYKQHAAGTLLSATMFEHALDSDKVKEIDYLTGDDGYKRDWMSDRRERIGIVAFNRSRPWGLALSLKNQLAEKLATRKSAD